MKRVLIITYYWPPAGGAGVQRWLKMSKYLPEFGWLPVIYTPERTEAPVEDASLLKDVREDLEVVRRPIWEPYMFYKWLVGKKRGERVNAGFLHEGKPPALAERISVWVRGNLLIPDPRCFWIRPSVRYLKNYLKEHPVDAVITTGPPHSMHMIGLGIKKHCGLPWIADFRDPWTKIDFYYRLKLTRWADRRHRALEKQILKNANEMVTIGWSSAEDFRELGAPNPVVITNGYDHQDFEETYEYSHSNFSITHAGVMNDDRDPVLLWEALRDLVMEVEGFDRDLRIRLIGKVDYTVNESLQKYGLNKYVERIPYLEHPDAVREMAQSAVLLLSINNTPEARGIVTGKLFEYIASRRPVLCISPVKGDSERIITESGAGVCVGYKGASSVKEELLRYYDLFRKKELFINKSTTTGYSRKEQAGQFADLLNSLADD